MFSITGFDDLDRKLQTLQRKLQALDATHEVSFNELFPDEFVRRHTRFTTLQEMIDASGIETPDEIGGPGWNEYVATNSSLEGWDEVKSLAGSEWARKQLSI